MIRKQLNDIIKAQEDPDVENDITPQQLASLICFMLDETILKSDEDDDKMDEWVNLIRQARCKVFSPCAWEYDHCGLWQHKLCYNCFTPKYPDLVVLNCSAARAATKGMSEGQWDNQLLEKEDE